MVFISVRGCVKLLFNILRRITAGWNVITSRRLDVTINLTTGISCYETTRGQSSTYAESYNALIFYRIVFPGIFIQIIRSNFS